MGLQQSAAPCPTIEGQTAWPFHLLHPFGHKRGINLVKASIVGRQTKEIRMSPPKGIGLQ